MHYRSVLILALIVAVLLGACGPGAAPEPPAAASTDPPAGGAEEQPAATSEAPARAVTITFGAISFMRYVYQPLIEAFNAQHPGITVQFVSLDEAYQGAPDYNEQARAIVSRADTADAPVSEEQFQHGLLYDLKPLIDADPSFNRDDFYPSALSSATSSSGAIYMLPRSLHIQLLFYNKDLWAARGLAAPKPDWTWQDVAAAAQQLAQKRGDTVSVYGVVDEDVYLGVLLAELRSAGLDLLSTPPTNARVDRPEVAAALERMANLFRSGAFYFTPPGQDSRDTVAQLVLNQQVGAWGSYVAGDIAARQPKQNGGSGSAAASFPTGVALYPPLPGGMPGFSDGYIMSSGTQHPQEAWTWLAFLGAQLIANQDGGKGGPANMVNMLPARKSLAEQSGYWSQLDEETKAAVQTTLDRPAPARSGVNLDSYGPLLRAIQDIIGGKSATQAASEAQAAIAGRVAQAQLTPTAAPNAAPVVVATPAPNVAPADATTITFALPLVKGGDQMTQVVERFNQSDAGVFVKLQDTFTGSGILSIPETAAQADCFVSPMQPAAGELTATLDLQPLIDADQSFTLNDYPAALLAPYRQGAALRGLPRGVDFRVLVYNKNLFDAAGLAAPAANWMPDDLLNAAQRLTSGAGDTRQYGFVIPRSTSQGVKFLIHLFGAATAQGSGETLRPTFTDPKVVQAARKVVDLLKNESPHARLNDYGANGPLADQGPLTGDGRAGMWFAWGPYAYGQGVEQPSFTLAMAPPPLAQAALDTDDVSTSGMYISAQTDKQQACWTWLKHFGATIVRGGSYFPANRSAAQSDALNQAQPGMAAVYNEYAAALDRVGQLAPGGDAPGTPSIDYYWFYRAVDRALQGKDLEQELAAAQSLTEQYIACVRGGGDRDACDRQVDPQYGEQ